METTYTTKLGNTYDTLPIVIDNDMPYGDYKELIDARDNKGYDIDLAPTMEGRGGVLFDLKDTDIITVRGVLNPENSQKIVYCYIPLSEVADYEMEVMKQHSSQYTDYQYTFADILQDADDKLQALNEYDEYYEKDKKEIEEEIEEIKEEIKELESKCTWNSWDL